MVVYAMIMTSIILGAVGQLLMKLGMVEITTHPSVSQLVFSSESHGSLALILSGIVCYLIAVFSWIYVLRSRSLNSVTPYLSLTYVLVFVGCAYLPGIQENISLLSAFGLIMILAGLQISVGRDVSPGSKVNTE